MPWSPSVEREIQYAIWRSLVCQPLWVMIFAVRHFGAVHVCDVVVWQSWPSFIRFGRPALSAAFAYSSRLWIASAFFLILFPRKKNDLIAKLEKTCAAPWQRILLIPVFFECVANVTKRKWARTRAREQRRGQPTTTDQWEEEARPPIADVLVTIKRGVRADQSQKFDRTYCDKEEKSIRSIKLRW